MCQSEKDESKVCKKFYMQNIGEAVEKEEKLCHEVEIEGQITSFTYHKPKPLIEHDHIQKGVFIKTNRTHNERIGENINRPPERRQPVEQRLTVIDAETEREKRG